MTERIEDIAQKMVAPGKGILAADESTGTMTKRLESINVPSTEDNRRDFREMLFRANDAMSNHISGVILYDETIRQKAKDGTPLVDVITGAGSIPGIKVDTGAKPLAGKTSGIETVTEGLDGLRERLAEYYEIGARFAKWRAVIAIADGCPTWNSIKANAHGLARYAALCQEAKIVPIVEPEVLMDGPHSVHDIEGCYDVTTWTLKTVFQELYDAGVVLEGMVLKPNMVIAGQKSPKPCSSEEVAEMTVKCLKACVPSSVPGIAFLSGGQSDEDATKHLSMINNLGPLPWQVTFSYGRALQAAALKTWGGKTENAAAAQHEFSRRAKLTGLAALGKWSKEAEAA